MKRLAITWLVLLQTFPLFAAERSVILRKRGSGVEILVDRKVVTRYVPGDEKTPRPFFEPLLTTTGKQVTRNRPPVEGQDAADHSDMHPGLWLSFGDISGNDYWRLKSRVEFIELLGIPATLDHVGHFAARHRYHAADGKEPIAEETMRVRVHAVEHGYRLEILSEFRPLQEQMDLGDQEEMGFAVRLATPLAADRKLGGRILDSEGRKNGAEIWGRTADWCDYSGPMENRWVGVTLMADPANFRPSWLHARDYGLLVLNPFGRKAFTKGETSRVVVRKGDVFGVNFAVVVHDTPDEKAYVPAAAFELYKDDLIARNRKSRR